MVMENSTSSSADYHPHAAAGGVVVLSSSIALLQERFRLLQKMKELREEKELLKMLSVSGGSERSPSPPLPPPLSSHNHHCYTFAGAPELKLLPAKMWQHCELPLSLSPDTADNSESREAGCSRGRGAMINGPPLNLLRSSSWFAADEPLLCTWPSPINVGNSGGSHDVDTSLRL